MTTTGTGEEEDAGNGSDAVGSGEGTGSAVAAGGGGDGAGSGSAVLPEGGRADAAAGPGETWVRGAGLVVSALLHLILLAAILGLLRLPTAPDQVEVVRVELVPAESAKPLEKAVPPAQPSPAAGEKPAPPADKSKSGAAAAKQAEAKPADDPAAAPPPGPDTNDPGKPGDSGAVATSSLAAKLSRADIDAVRAQVQRCWKIPSGWTNPRQVSVAVRFRLKRDGSVDGNPLITEGPASALGKAAADNAVLAVKRCGPYPLPADSYKEWRVMELHLAPG